MELSQYIWLILMWSVYFTIHSLLASQTIKSKLVEAGLPLKAQRIIYNLVAIVGLLSILIYNGTLSPEVLIPKTQFSKIAALFLGGAGVLIINAAFKQFNSGSFLGIKDEPSELRRDGILKHIRHPLYAGTILMVAGLFVYDPRTATLVSAICIYIYLPIGIYLEEKKLVNQFGQLYISYRKEVPAIIPRVKLF